MTFLTVVPRILDKPLKEGFILADSLTVPIMEGNTWQREHSQEAERGRGALLLLLSLLSPLYAAWNLSPWDGATHILFSSLNLYGNPHGHAHRYVSMVIVNSVELTIEISHHRP